LLWPASPNLPEFSKEYYTLGHFCFLICAAHKNGDAFAADPSHLSGRFVVSPFIKSKSQAFRLSEYFGPKVFIGDVIPLVITIPNTRATPTV